MPQAQNSGGSNHPWAHLMAISSPWAHQVTIQPNNALRGPDESSRLEKAPTCIDRPMHHMGTSDAPRGQI